MKSTMVCASALFLAVGLAAQDSNKVIHPHYTLLKEGVSSEMKPFGVRDAKVAKRSFRWQQIHDKLDAKAVTIKSMTFRRDGAQRYDWESYKVTLELSLSTSPRDSQTASTTFSQNMGPDAKVVVARKQISFPASRNTSGLPEPFAFTIPFDPGRAFPLQAARNLCWEVKVHDNDLYTASQQHRHFDAVSRSSDGVFAYYGDGCFAPGMYKSFWGDMNFGFDQPKNSFLLTGQAQEGPMQGYVFALISPSRLTWGLPFGAPRCHFWIDPTAFLVSGPYKLDYKGQVKVTSTILSMPNVPSHYGFNLYGQWVAVDRNMTGIYLSNGVKVQKGYVWTVCQGPDVSQIFNQGTSATTGFVNNFAGLVVEFGI